MFCACPLGSVGVVLDARDPVCPLTLHCSTAQLTGCPCADSNFTMRGFEGCPGVRPWLLPDTMVNWLLLPVTVLAKAVNESVPSDPIEACTTFTPGAEPSVKVFVACPLASERVTACVSFPP